MPGDHGSKVDISFAGRFTASAIAACFAEVCTLPLDTAKVRLQLQKNVVAGDAAALPKYRGLLGTAATIAREEGAAALWKGVIPGLHRQCIYGGLRIGLYEPVKSFYVGKDHVGDVPLSKKIAAGFTTGAIAISIANPTDLVKEGVAALWTGLGPNVARNAIINAAELASYDQVKQTILKLPGFKDDMVTHLFAGLGAGFFAVCVGSPVDVVRCPLLLYVKSRMMGDSAYKSTLDCFVKTLKNDVQKLFVRKPAS
ncbi:Mitochondrial uncoupling protein 1 [Dichanthelium oligosanthes]|uniref:Mitochondrial uncoupling protein 1 n=1 Tax=Dichanthelium oligosanthes TaxID=888268 RepID=A0A1E5VLG0_9POAL|nr:Mitochondrial uncoupling protein 1 [Dichanthelium oligosanthes]